MRTVVVRRARVGDGEAVGIARCVCWRATYAKILPKSYLDQLTPNGPARDDRIAAGQDLWVAEDDLGKIVGFADLDRDDQGRPMVSALYVLPDWMGEGLGASLLHAIAQEVVTRGESCLTIGCFQANHRARRAYEAWGARWEYDGTWEAKGKTYPTYELIWDDLAALVERVTPTPLRLVRIPDDLEPVTDLVHRAYAPLAAMGLRFVATHQSVEVTRERFADATGLIMERNDKIVGTVRVREIDSPYGEYRFTHRVASFGQLAIEPELRGLRLGERLVRAVERWALENGMDEIALDTAQPATHLVRYYQRLGYRIVGVADWRPEVNYPSYILAKALKDTPIRDT